MGMNKKVREKLYSEPRCTGGTIRSCSLVHLLYPSITVSLLLQKEHQSDQEKPSHYSSIENFPNQVTSEMQLREQDDPSEFFGICWCGVPDVESICEASTKLFGSAGSLDFQLNSFPVKAVWGWREVNFAILPFLPGQIV